jgi:hypothetical protein
MCMSTGYHMRQSYVSLPPPIHSVNLLTELHVTRRGQRSQMDRHGKVSAFVV